MFEKRKEKRRVCDVNYYTARRLGDMADSLGRLAKAFDDEIESGRQLTREDGLAAMQTSSALVCDGCTKCSLRTDTEKEDSYYLYYLLRAFEQKGHIDNEDMPQMFQSSCRKKDKYLGQLNRNLGRATMNLSWTNRFMESRDAVVVQFREMSMILEEFSHQMDQARDVTEDYEAELRKFFRRAHIAVQNLLILEYENGQREAYITARTTNGRCMTSREAAGIVGQAMEDSFWSPARDSRTIITRQYATVRFLEDGSYHMLCGAARIPKQG